MHLSKAKDILAGLTPPQTTRLHAYCRNLSTDKNKVHFDDKVRDCLIERGGSKNFINSVTGYLDSIGFSQSIYEYDQIKDQIHRFTGCNHQYTGWNRNFQRAKETLIKEVKAWKLKPLVLETDSQILGALPRKDSHAGFSLILTGKRVKSDYMEGVGKEFSNRRLQAVADGSFNCPILIGSRTQASGAFDDDGKQTGTFKSKTRMVSMVDIYQVLGECTFSKPFQERLGVSKWYAGGKDDASINGILQRHRAIYPYYLTIDYSSFDQTISDWLIHAAFDIIRSSFINVSEIEESLFNVIRNDFIHKVFIDGKGMAIESHKGVPSGSMFTQLVDTIVNRLMIDTYMISMSINDYRMMIMGDDNIIFCRTDLELEKLSSYLSKQFGVTVNVNKCSQAKFDRFTYPTFLSREWRLDGCYRAPEVLISKMCYPERFRDYEKHGFIPEQVIHSYHTSYPLGMYPVISVDNLFKMRRSVVKGSPEGQKFFMSGLDQYRLIYGERG